MRYRNPEEHGWGLSTYLEVFRTEPSIKNLYVTLYEALGFSHEIKNLENVLYYNLSLGLSLKYQERIGLILRAYGFSESAVTVTRRFKGKRKGDVLEYLSPQYNMVVRVTIVEEDGILYLVALKDAV